MCVKESEIESVCVCECVCERERRYEGVSECMIQIKKDDKMLNGSKVGENFLACPFTSFCLVIILSCISNFRAGTSERGRDSERKKDGKSTETQREM